MREQLSVDRETNVSAPEMLTAEDAFSQFYLTSGTAEFKKAAAEQPRHIDLIQYDDLTLAGAVNVDAQGERLPGHDYDPESRFHNDVRAAFQRWEAGTPEEKRIAIVEGGAQSFPSENEAVKRRAENGQVAFLAGEENIPCISGDVDGEDSIAELLRLGEPSEDIALLWSVRDLPSFARSNIPQEYLGAFLYHQAGFAKVEGFSALRRDQRIEMRDGKLDAESVSQMNAQVREKLLPQWHARLGQYIFAYSDKGISMNIEPEALEKELVPLWSTNMSGPLSALARQHNAIRDKHLYKTIVDQIQDGKQPFVTFGGSHVLSIKPALDAFLGEGRRVPQNELQR